MKFICSLYVRSKAAGDTALVEEKDIYGKTCKNYRNRVA